jgi:hypothetical protein
VNVHSRGPSTKTPSPRTTVDHRIIPTESGTYPLEAIGTGPRESSNRLGAGRGTA